MRHIMRMVFFVSGLLMLYGCSAGQPSNETASGQQASAEKAAAIEFEKTTHDFGQLQSGEKVAYAFRFTNTGNAPLVITDTRSGCGCTVGEYSRQPIAPGQSGRINVMFNSAGRRGFQSESIRIFTNAQPADHVLRITAEVVRE